jgi:hypothetical protein
MHNFHLISHIEPMIVCLILPNCLFHAEVEVGVNVERVKHLILMENLLRPEQQFEILQYLMFHSI